MLSPSLQGDVEAVETFLRNAQTDSSISEEAIYRHLAIWFEDTLGDPREFYSKNLSGFADSPSRSKAARAQKAAHKVARETNSVAASEYDNKLRCVELERQIQEAQGRTMTTTP